MVHGFTFSKPNSSIMYLHVAHLRNMFHSRLVSLENLQGRSSIGKHTVPYTPAKQNVKHPSKVWLTFCSGWCLNHLFWSQDVNTRPRLSWIPLSMALRAVVCQKIISVDGDGHCCHRPTSNWETTTLLWTAFSCNLLWKKIDSLVSRNKRCLLNAIPTPVLRGCFDVLSTTLVSQSLCVGSFP